MDELIAEISNDGMKPDDFRYLPGIESKRCRKYSQSFERNGKEDITIRYIRFINLCDHGKSTRIKSSLYFRFILGNTPPVPVQPVF